VTNEQLARRLDELGGLLEYPPTPDLTGAVLVRIEGLPPRRRRGLVLVAAAALAVTVAAAAVLAASPRARSAVLDWLGIGGVRIVRVDELPPVPLRGEPYYGERVSLAEAGRRVDFDVHLPRLDTFEQPDAVYVKDFPPGGMVTLLYGSLREPKLVLSQWLGYAVEPVVLKSLPRDARLDYVDVNGSRALWLHGPPHAVFFLDRRGEDFEESLVLAGNVLLWERGALAFRLQADVDRDDAARIARSLG
jgi:hypothetical protein